MATQRIASLAEVPTGERVEIRSILFELLREECARAGILEGGTVQVLANASSRVEVAVERGRNVWLRRDRIRFIEVELANAD